jgi:hypothetical protein
MKVSAWFVVLALVIGAGASYLLTKEEPPPAPAMMSGRGHDR